MQKEDHVPRKRILKTTPRDKRAHRKTVAAKEMVTLDATSPVAGKPFKWTHSNLIYAVSKWAVGVAGYPVCVTECKVKSTKEIPDALAFKANGNTALFEIKVSHSDFAADAGKKFRTDVDKGMGLYRYYVVPWDLVGPEEVAPGWGLIWVGDSGKVSVRKQSSKFLRRKAAAEISTLVSALRRMAPQAEAGVSAKLYKVATGSRTGIYLEEMEETDEDK
jgi:hypothetical protein